MRYRYYSLVPITFVLMVAAGCGSSSYNSNPPTNPTPTPTPTPAPSGATPVAIPNGASVLGTDAFRPNPTMIAVGGSVTWTNTDVVAHTATSNSSVWNSSTIAPGAQFSFTFPNAGTFPYHCTFHPGMVGTIVVQ
jgi:plastocyanin